MECCPACGGAAQLVGVLPLVCKTCGELTPEKGNSQHQLKLLSVCPGLPLNANFILSCLFSSCPRGLLSFHLLWSETLICLVSLY